MENNLNFETVASMVERMRPFMARSSMDSTELGIVKGVLRLAAFLTGSAAVGVIVLQDA